MAEAKLTIDIDVDGVAKAVTGLKSVNRAVRDIDSRTRGLAQTSGTTGTAVQTAVDKWKKSFDQFDKMIKAVGSIGLKGLTMSLKFATLEMVAMGAAMVAIHGAFVVGNAAMKAMRATLGPLAAGMTAVVAAAAAASAAIREQQAAMWAYKTKNAPEFGGGVNQTRQVMRTLQSDTELATVGIENLNKAYSTVSKTSTFTAKSQVILKGLMDFASAGQPIEEGIQKASELIAMLQDSKKSFSDVKASAQQLFPDKKAMDKALKDLKITTKQGLEKAITSGELAKAAGVEGQFKTVSSTVMNQFKGFITQIRGLFADMGQPLLEPIANAAQQIFNILRRGFIQISGNTQKFGMGSMLEGLVSMVDKLTTWSVNLINNNIKSVDGMFSKMAGWWKDFKYGWNEVLDRLRPFIDGAEVIEKMFGQVWIHVKNIVGSKFNDFNSWLVQNEETVLEFGAKVGDLITSIMNFQTEMRKILQDLMPFINDVVGGIASMVDQMTGFIKLLRGLTGGGAIGALASLLAIRSGFSAMKNTKGGFTVSQKVQPINAQQVVINTPSVVSGGGNLGTTGAAMGAASAGGAAGGASGLASASNPRLQAIGAQGQVNRLGLASASGGTSAPYSYTGAYIGQPGYAGPALIRPRGGPLMQSAIAGANVYRQWSSNTFLQPGESDDDRRTRLMRKQNAAGTGYSRMAKFRQRQAAQRAARSGPNQSAGYRRLNQFQGSQMARMGTGLALGAISQFAPAEAQGALALGGMVGTMNPLAGLAVAGLGTAYKAKTATGGMLSGAGGGAAAGALIGSIIPGVGTAAGAVAGAFIGAIGGGIMGGLNKGKAERKAARTAASNAAQSIINNVLSGVLDAVRKEGGTKGKTALRTALPSMRRKQREALNIINQAPGKRGNYYGIVPDFMDRGATGGQLGLAFENYTGKRMPNLVRKFVGSATTSMDIAGNLGYGLISKLGGKSLLDNRVLNPLGYGTDNLKDVDKRKQQEALRKLYRNQKGLGLTISETEFEDMMKKPGDSLEQMRKNMETNEKAMKPLQNSYNSRMDQLNKITGKTDTEINDLARSMGVNLMDNTKSFAEVLKELGLSVLRTTEQLRAATSQVYVNALKGFDKALERIKAPQILDETAKGFRQIYEAQGGKVTDEQKINFFKDIMEQNLAFFGGDAMKAYSQTVLSLQKGGTAFTGKGPLRGLNIDFLNDPAISGVLGETEAGLASQYGARLNERLLRAGVSVDATEFQKRFQALDPKEQARVAGVLEKGFGSSAGAKQMIEAAGGNAQQAMLNAIGMGDLKIKKIEDKTTDLANVSEEIANATTKLIEQMSVYFKEANEAVPSWYNTPPEWYKKTDTSTPRGQAFGDTTSSRLSQTMGRHAQMNGMLTGKRTMTSSYRTFGLGSINSDHVTGRAYDLVGQNLGQYQSLVRATGGFAEFHGINGDRHLHVVPGSGAIGDRAVPVMNGGGAAPVTMTSAGGGNNYNFYISGGKNASANEIAEMVMQKVKETERSNRERR